MIMVTRKTSLLRSFLLGLTLAVGFAVLWGVLVGWFGTSIVEAWVARNSRPRERLVVTADGTPLIMIVPHDNLSLTTYRDLSGRVREDVDRAALRNPEYVNGVAGTVDEYLTMPDWRQRLRLFVDEREPLAIWYFVQDGRLEGTGYFVGYERVSNRLIGYIGLSGFRNGPVPPGDRIPARSGSAYLAYWSSVPVYLYGSDWGRRGGYRVSRWDVAPRLVHVPSGKALRVVDLSARTVRTVFESPDPIVSVTVPTLSSLRVGILAKELPILIRAGQKVYRLDHRYQLLNSFTIPAEVTPQTTLEWYETEDGHATAVAVLPRTGPGPSNVDFSRTAIYRVAPDGKLLASSEVTLHTSSSLGSEQTQFSLTILVVPSPGALAAIGAFVALGPERPGGYLASLRAIFVGAWRPALVVIVISCILAGVVWRRCRVYGRSRGEQIVWAAFVLLLGVPAYAGFLLHRRWPVRLACPHCHAWSPRDRAACSACGTPFPAPALKGIEIFA